jgi:predicted nucleic acid-binding protein
LFASVRVPSSVVAEVTDPISRQELQAALNDWLTIEEPCETSLGKVLGMRTTADQAVISLALDHPPCILVTADQQVMRKAATHRVPCITPPGIVRMLVEKGHLDLARPVLDRMTDLGFGIPRDVYEEILRALGE